MAEEEVKSRAPLSLTGDVDACSLIQDKSWSLRASQPGGQAMEEVLLWQVRMPQQVRAIPAGALASK